MLQVLARVKTDHSGAYGTCISHEYRTEFETETHSFKSSTTYSITLLLILSTSMRTGVFAISNHSPPELNGMLKLFTNGNIG